MENELGKLLKLIDEEPEKFNDKIPETERKLFREISVLIKDLKLTGDGKIAPSIENLNLINSIKGKINKIAVSKEYTESVKRFVSNFPAIAGMTTGHAPLPAETKKLISAVTRQTIDNTLESLTGAGYRQEVVSKINSILLTNVTSGGSYADLTEQLREMLVSTEKKPGLLSKYARMYVTDALSQYDGNLNKTVSAAMGYEWFRYGVSNITTTREFCEHLTKKDFFHVTEIPALLRGEIDGHQCEIYDKTGLPKGMVEGTNEDNFFTYRGGYNCRHRINGVPTESVPKALREKFKENSKRIAEYEQLKADPNYSDVNFNPSNGGLTAIHKEHNFSNEKGVFGVARGEYERLAVKALYENGDKIILNSEAQRLDAVTGRQMKRPDGYLNNKLCDIKGIESDGETSIRNSLNSARKQKVETAVLYFHDAKMYSEQKVLDGWGKYKDFVSKSNSINDKNLYINEVVCIVNGKVIKLPI